MEVELDEVQWRSPEWTQAFGLTTENVLDYFALSPWYDRSSNNQVLKMQTNFAEQLQRNPGDINRELAKMRGVEFVVALAREPEAWVIRKQLRHSPTSVDIIATYFVVGENVYQAPSVYSVVSSRILATARGLSEGLAAARKLPYFNSAGYTYSAPSDDKQVDVASLRRQLELDRALDFALEAARDS